MSDEQVTPVTGNSTEVDWDNPSNPYIQREKEQQAGFTKSQQELAAERSVWEDKQAALARLAEKHPDLFEDEDEEDDLDENERPLTQAEFKAWQAEQKQQAEQDTRQQEGARKFEADFKEFVGDRELSPHGARAIRSTPDLNGPDDLKKAVDDWFAYEDSLKGPAKRPRAPHVPTNGSAATDVPNWDEMTQGEINQYMAEKIRGHQAQT